MMLKRELAKRKERADYPSGRYCITYFFDCLECGGEIRVQSGSFRSHSGKCMSCSHKGRKYGAAYTQLVGNKKRGIPVNLTYKEFITITIEERCHYCLSRICRTTKRREKGYRGYFLDRKDNSLGYSVENCVPCCWRCNQTKGNRYSYEEFYEMTAMFRVNNVIPVVDYRGRFLSLNNFYE